MNNNQSDIAKFFANKNVLITGGSGFIGKLLIQKLIRSCPEIKGIYLIIRQKKEKSASERIDDFLKCEVFDKAREADPNFKRKIHVLPGNMNYLGLGLSYDDRNLIINNINIVMHCAAIVLFTSSLKDAVETNVRGTKELLDLCEEIKNLDVVMYMSTLFSHAERGTIGEYFMASPIQPDTLLDMKDQLEEGQFNNLEKSLLQGKIFTYENVYVYTKAVCEEIVRQKSKTLPIGLFRPSIILFTYKDPLECWTDNFYGVIGLVTLTYLGLLRVYLSNRKNLVQYTPADYCVNGFIATTYDVYKKNKIEQKPQEIVYNMTSGENTPTTVESHQHVVNNMIPSSKAVWVPTLSIVDCIYYYWILCFFYQILPALVMDVVRLLTFKKPKFLKMFFKLEKLTSAVGYFTSKNWKAPNENTLKVYRNLNSVDQKMFPFDISTLNWNDFWKNSGYGVKKYILKEKVDEKSLENAKQRFERLQFYHKILIFVTYTIGAFIIWNIFKSFF